MTDHPTRWRVERHTRIHGHSGDTRTIISPRSKWLLTPQAALKEGTTPPASGETKPSKNSRYHLVRLAPDGERTIERTWSS